MTKLSSCAALIVTSLSNGFLSLRQKKPYLRLVTDSVSEMDGLGISPAMEFFIGNWNVFFTLQGVESERCASFQAAMNAGHPVKIEANQSLTLADGEISFVL